ncbi:MAG: hypothetical protein HF314_16775 [Ignavibacteria bacterium]|jgi:hypothetical protein|nr:hypothetical protein [Ignavibacteria bacterium]MCU7504739.1 hypothetical protein [Ignavibacteria bacterium]MCU7516341.1 hypothetical protein [Ignavibacteria bacterium]
MRKEEKKERIKEIRQLRKLKMERKKWQYPTASDFKVEYCQMLMDHCSQGYSCQSFAAKINVMPEVLERWTDEYPEFKNARLRAELQLKMFWEMLAVEACKKKFSISVFRYYTGDGKEQNPPASGRVVILPEEESSK